MLDSCAGLQRTQLQRREIVQAAIQDQGPDGWVRLPKGRSKCSYTGLGRSALFQLLQSCRGQVRMADLRVGRETRGSRLYHAGDLHRHLLQTAIQQWSTTHES